MPRGLASGHCIAAPGVVTDEAGRALRDRAFLHRARSDPRNSGVQLSAIFLRGRPLSLYLRDRRRPRAGRPCAPAGLLLGARIADARGCARHHGGPVARVWPALAPGMYTLV